MRSLRSQQDRCHVTLAAKSNKTGGNSHGFEFSRTLSCAKPPRRIGHIRHKSHIRHIKDQVEHTCLFCAFVHFVPYVAANGER